MNQVSAIDLWTIFLTAFFVTLATTPLSIVLARKTGAMDVPKDARRVHDHPVPRIGGIGIFFGIMLGYFVAIKLGLCDHPDVGPREIYGVFLGGLIIFIVGLIDDVRGMRPAVKLTGQIAAALTVFLFGVNVSSFGGFIGNQVMSIEGFVSLIFTVLWIIGITNTINLIDGLDGLAAGIVAISTCCIAYVAYIHGNYHIACVTMLAMAGACIGFLPYNFYPAKTFMGDCGSLSLGATLAVVALISRHWLVLPLIAIIPVSETISVILQVAYFKLTHGKRLFRVAPIHHHFQEKGWSEMQVVQRFWLISLLFAMLGVGLASL